MPVALITGAATGIGKETARQLAELGWTVILTARTAAQAEAAAAELAPAGEVVPMALDVTSDADAAAVAERVRARFGGLDALVNNAAVILVASECSGILDESPAEVLGTVDVNTVGALRVTQALVPLLEARRGTVVNLSSGMGALSGMGGGYFGYRLSKAGMNALTRVLHAELHGRGIRVNSVCPGWVKTPFGGPGATREVPEGARGVVWLVTRGEDGPSGGFFRDGEPIAW